MTSAIIREIVGRAIPLPGDDVDTDRIIPGRFLRTVTFEGLEEHVFADDRQQDPHHPFNQDRYRGASLLIVGRNFGCGSSREHAPQALKRWGIRGIIGPSFAEIFFANCTAIGLPCVTIAAEEARALQEAVAADPQQELRLNLETMTLHFQERAIPVQMPEGVRRQFLEGTWNSTLLLLGAGSEIERTAERLPYVTGF